MATTISYQPWRVGQTYATWEIPMMTDGGAEDLSNITVSNYSLWFRTLNGAETQGAGTITLQSAYPGVLLYKSVAADVAAVFSGYIVIRGLYPPSNTTADKPIYDPIPFSIVP